MYLPIPAELLVSMFASTFGIFKSIRFVHEGERGIRLRFGKAVRKKDKTPKIIEPGFVLLIPFIDTLRRHHVRQQSMRFEDQRIVLKDGLIFKVGAMVIFKVEDIYKALFDIDDLDGSITDLCMARLRDVLQPCTHTELSDSDDISKKLLSAVEEKSKEWGVIFIHFGLTDCAPTPETANLINVEIGVEMKMHALDIACKKRNLLSKDLNPVLAATLIGIPLSANITNDISFITEPEKVSAEKEDQ